MGEDNGRVIPGLRVAEAGLVELAHCNHGVLRLTVNLVASYVQAVWEAVVLAVLLKLAERITHQGWVDDADGGGCLCIVAKSALFSNNLGVVLDYLNIVYSECGSGGLDVLLEVGSLKGSLIRNHDKRLNNPGVKPANNQRANDHQSGRDD